MSISSGLVAKGDRALEYRCGLCTESTMGPHEPKVERRLAAIFAADVAGYSRLMSQDEVGTLRTLSTYREIMDRLIAEYGHCCSNLKRA
jgi:adenylate cyclase